MDYSMYSKCGRCDGSGLVPGSRTGAILRHLRERSGLSQIRIAKAMKLSAQYIVMLESDRRTWTHALVHAYTKALVKKSNHAKRTNGNPRNGGAKDQSHRQRRR